MHIKNLVSGLMFVLFSLIFLMDADTLSFGTLAEIGPGFFPTVISTCLLLVGLVIIFKKSDD